MKKLILSLTLLSGFVTFAQSTMMITNTGNSATVAPNATIAAITTASNVTSITLDVKNTSANTQQYIVKRYDTHLFSNGTSTASAYFCFAANCYGDFVTVSPSSLTLTAGQSASQLAGSYNMLVADLQEANTVGYSMVKYTFANTANANDTLQVTIQYNQTLGLNKNDKVISSYDLYPMPVSDVLSLKINSLKATEGKISIFDNQGKVVSEKNISLNAGKNRFDINTESLAPGVYFSSLTTEGTSTTKKFIVK